MQARPLALSYIETEAALYRTAATEMPRIARRRFPPGRQRIWQRRILWLAEWLDDHDVTMPGELMQPYPISVPDRVRSAIPLKYQYRALNALREMTRARVMFPELLTHDQPRDILDLSAGGCGTAEVFGHFGHRVTICDYYENDKLNTVGHSYARIHESLGLTCRFFDGRVLPYPFYCDSFDIVLSYQAIDAYGPVPFWYDAVADMLRIARRSVGLVLNPAHPRTPESREQTAQFIADMQDRHSAALSSCPETSLPSLRIDKG